MNAVIEKWIEEVSKSSQEATFIELEGEINDEEDKENMFVTQSKNHPLASASANKSKSAIGDDEIINKYKEGISDQYRCFYYPTINGALEIERRLQPQLFQHHSISTKEVLINEKCPSSAGTDDMLNYAILHDYNIRKNALTYRYYRYVENTRMCLCRLCPFKKWIDQSKFSRHLSLAHGIVLTGTQIIGLPIPSAIFRQDQGRLKNYYCKCCNCGRWIRLGFCDVESCIDAEIIKQHRILQGNIDIIGIFTNYFSHFMQCISVRSEGRC